jgi:hypothetical protein
MLLQTNSYIVPKDKRAEHQRLIRRFRQTLKRLGCDHFEVYEQVGPNWSSSESSGRFVDRKHQLSVQTAERSDPTAQAVIADFCDLINFPYQQQQGLFAVGFYTSVLPVAPKRGARGELISTVEHEVLDDDEPVLPGEGGMGEVVIDDAAPTIDPAAVVAPRRDMIDSVLVDGPTTSAGELHDVLQADAPVHNLEGTPPETVTADLQHVPGGASTEAGPGVGAPAAAEVDATVKEDPNGFEVAEEVDDEEHANGFVLEDAAEGRRTDRPTW